MQNIQYYQDGGVCGGGGQILNLYKVFFSNLKGDLEIDILGHPNAPLSNQKIFSLQSFQGSQTL